MKRTPSILMATLLLISIILTIPAFAGSANLSLRASSSAVRIGDTVTVTGYLSGSDKIGTFDLNITYNVGQLEYAGATGISPAINSGELDVTPSGGSIHLLYLDADGGVTGINNANAFKITFKVIGGNVGDAIAVGAEVKTFGDSNASGMSASVSNASMSIAAPLSGNTNLSSLTVSNATISPSFNKDVTSYKASVDFSVGKLNISATAEDANSKVTVNSPALTAGGTTSVSIVVTAQSGAKKTYTILVTRAQDPNYKPSSNNNLSGITVNLGILSPAFSPDVTSYVVWLPYEVQSITVAGTPADAKASVAVDGGNNLIAGKDNTIKVICKAEDGTTKTYKVIAKRAAGNGESVSSIDKDKVAKEISAANKDKKDQIVTVDLSEYGSKKIEGSIFNTLAENKNASIRLQLGGAQITFKGEDVKKQSSDKSYDFTYTKNSEYSSTMIKAAGNDSKTFTYSFAYHGDLPGYATFDINTDFTPGEKVNVYKYDPDKKTYILIAENVQVSSGGIVSYVNNSCSHYMITTGKIPNAQKSEAVSKQVKSGSNVALIVILGIVVLAAGVAIGYFLKIFLLKKQNNLNK